MRSMPRARAAVLLAAATLTASATAGAEGLPLDRFDPAPAGDRMFDVPSPGVSGHLVPQFSTLFDYAHNPLVFRSGNDAVAVVSNQLFLHLNASLALWNRLSLNLEMPIALMQAGTSVSAGASVAPAPDKSEPGDLRAGARVRIFGAPTDGFQLGLSGYVWLPTAGSGGYVGAGKARGMPQLLLGGRTNRVVWSFAAGPKIQGTQTFAGVTQGTELDVGAGVGILLLDDRSLQIGPEVYSAFTLVHDAHATGDAFRRASNVEILADVRYRIAKDIELGAGMGPGLTVGIGTPDLRGLMMVTYRPDASPRSLPPAQIERAGLVPPPAY